MSKCIEQEIRNISYMKPNKRIKLNDRYMKIDPAMWINVEFERMNVSVDDTQRRTLFINNPIETSNNIVRNPVYENLKLEERG